MKYLFFIFVVCIAACKVQPWHEDLIKHKAICQSTYAYIDSVGLIIYDVVYSRTIDSVLYSDTIPCIDTCYALSYFAERPYYCTSGRLFREPFGVNGELFDVGSVTNRKKQGTWETLIEVTDTSEAVFSWINKYLLLYSSVYKDGLRNGSFVAYNIYTSKVLYKTEFVNGTGYEKTYYQCKGTPIRSEGQFAHDKKTGKWIYYSVTGKKTAVYY